MTVFDLKSRSRFGSLEKPKCFVFLGNSRSSPLRSNDHPGKIPQIGSIGFFEKTPILQAFSQDSITIESGVIHNHLLLFN